MTVKDIIQTFEGKSKKEIIAILKNIKKTSKF